jgi:hypothetical protein
MNTVFKFLIAIVIGFVAYGYYINYNDFGQGEKFIGIGVLIFALVLMPLFVYHRYKNKDLSRYSFKNNQKKEDN